MTLRSLLLALAVLLTPAIALAADNDGDGFDEAEDCNDDDPAVYPGADEGCNGVDNDCDGLEDTDDGDGDGFINCQDCDDADAEVNASAEEICDGIDNDCRPETDEETDLDGDGFNTCEGDCSDDPNEQAGSDLEGPFDADEDGQTFCEGDCDDQDPVLNRLDLDGDGEFSCDTDCDDTDPVQNTQDVDEDDFTPCEGDCDDEDPNERPFNEEICGDGLDNDCTGAPDDLDVDLDEAISPDCGGDDCDDEDPTISPDAGEEAFTCLDDIDNDCDGLIDDEDEHCWAEPDVDAGPDRQQKYLGGTAVLVLDGSGTEDANPTEQLEYVWTLDTPADAYPGVTVELIQERTSPFAFLRFHADAGTQENNWTFEAHLVVSDPHFTTDPEDSKASVVLDVFRPTYYSSIDCSLSGHGSQAAPLGLLLLLGLVLRRRR